MPFSQICCKNLGRHVLNQHCNRDKTRRYQVFICIVSEFEYPKIGGIRYSQIHHYLIDWFEKIHHFLNMLVLHLTPLEAH
jgi:hypothetical protein